MEKLDIILPNVLLCLIPRPITAQTIGKFVRLDNGEISDSDDENPNSRKKRRKISDNAFNQQVLDALEAVDVILDHVPELYKSHKEFVEQAIAAAFHLIDHEWMKMSLKAVEITEKVVQTMEEEKLRKALKSNANLGILSSPREDIQQIVVNLCNKLSTMNEFEAEFGGNFLNVMLKLMPAIAEIPEDFENEDTFDVSWVCREIRKILNNTIDEDSPNPAMKRHIYSWISSIVEVLNGKKLIKVAQTILAPPIKEMLEDQNGPFREETITIWNNLQKKFAHDPGQWAKIQNIYNALKLGIDKRNKKVETKKRKAAELRERAKKVKLDDN